MADIFISYAREDREIAKTLAQALAEQGWSVWWDQGIPPGKTWADVIGKQLLTARCVLALWSKASVTKRWVLKEARFADQRGTLIPVLIEAVEPPFEFSDIQAADLTDWQGDGSHPGYKLLLGSVWEVLSASPTAATDAQHATVGKGLADVEPAVRPHHPAEPAEADKRCAPDEPGGRRTAAEGPQTSPSTSIFHPKRWMALLGAVAAVAAAGVVAWQEFGKESPPAPSPPLVAEDTTKPSIAPPATEPTVKPDQLEVTATTPTKDQPGQTFRDCDGCPEMVVIPKGEFVMGSPESEAERYDDEGPQHEVTILHSFAVSKYETTRGEYTRFVEATGHAEGDGCFHWTGTEWKKDVRKSWRNSGFSQTDDHPAVCVSWDDAKAYVEWLSDKTGKRYRLLTEAEWEYAARAGTTTARFWGDNADGSCSYANTADLTAKDQLGRTSVANCRDGYVYTAPVGTFQPNGFGLYDMLGNVLEWLEDCWHADYAGAPSDGSAWTGGRDCSARVLRGGSWSSNPRGCRSANRSGIQPDDRNIKFGFRVARTLN